MKKANFFILVFAVFLYAVSFVLACIGEPSKVDYIMTAVSGLFLGISALCSTIASWKK